MKIWGRITSINVRKVVLTAQWLGLAFERIDAGRQFGIVQTEAYRARNPNGLIPLLDDDGFELWESNAIVRYLAAKHAPRTLYPEPLQARFDAERWMDWQQTTLNIAGKDAFVQLIRTAPEARSDALIARSVSATESLWDLLERHLARQPFLAGDHFTMADIPIACEAHRWRGLGLAPHPRAHLDAWYARIASSEAARGVFDIPLE
ncbi:MAG TPA: glutathione S-transferase family protein [Polyangiales bacterium]|nr:glutathione S-transferase family protein [Polyangiales bacterium]